MGIGIGTAILGGALIGGGASIVSGIAGAKAARQATSAQTRAQNRALELQREQFEQSRADIEPFRQLGVGAISPLQNLLGPDVDIGAFLEGTPGFRAALEGGVRAIDAGAANTGRLGSGARAKALTRFGSDLASRTLTQERNALFDATRIGSGQAANLANRSSAFAAAGSNILGNIGSIQGQGILNRNSAFQAGLQGVTGAAGNVLGALSTPGLFGGGGSPPPFVLGGQALPGASSTGLFG